MKKVAINPETLFDSRKYGFSQVIVSKPGRLVFISGQVAWDKDMQIVGVNDLALQTQKSIDNLENAIAAAGGSLEDIVMLRIYKVNYQQEDGAVISELLRHNFGTLNPPASTWISVESLANDSFMIEIEAQAIVS